MKKFLTLILGLVIVSCNQNQTNHGVMQNDDDKSLIVEKLADSYLAGNFDMAREYFSEDGKHYFNDLEFDVDGIIEGYNSHSLIFNDIKHNDRKIYTGYFSDGSVETFHDFNWSATSIISGKEYYYPVFDDVRSNAILTAILAYKASEEAELVSREKRVMPINPRTGRTRDWPSVRKPNRDGSDAK